MEPGHQGVSNKQRYKARRDASTSHSTHIFLFIQHGTDDRICRRMRLRAKGLPGAFTGWAYQPHTRAYQGRSVSGAYLGGGAQ